MRLALDAPRAVRPGEELPLEPLRAFLERHLPGLAGPLVVEQFPSGYSNLTYLLRCGGRELVLRRPPLRAGLKTAHDVVREQRILTALAAVYPKVPRVLAACADEAVLGAPFYVMERVRGVIPRGGPALPRDAVRRASEALVDTLAELHAVDYRAAGLGALGRPEGYVERQVRGWSERYARARTDDLPELERTAAWLLEHRPADGAPVLIHNDFKYDNLVFDAQLGRVLAVLDWEMATIGDALMDLGTTLAYWADPGDPEEWHRVAVLPLTFQPGSLDRAGLAERYALKAGRELPPLVFYYAFGLFKVAVIAQQIYARYKRGHTADPRFAGLIEAVRACGRLAARAIDLGRLDRLA